MATVTAGVHTTSTSNVSSYATASFTPAANDLLLVLVQATGTTTNPATVSNSLGLTFSYVTRATHNAGADQTALYVANSLAAASSQTCTWDCTGDAATGATVVVLRVAGMSRTGTNAIRQSAVQSGITAASTPAPAFGAAALTGNACIGFFGNGTSTAGRGVPTTSWTEVYDLAGYSTPTGGIHVQAINSGFTGTTVTWGGTTATSASAIIAELDTSLPGSHHALENPYTHTRFRL